MWPKVEVCQVSNPLEWESSLNGQILQWLWKLSEIIHKYLALSSFPAELYSGNLGKQKLVQIQALLTLAGFFFFSFFLNFLGDQENSGLTHFANTAPFELLGFSLQSVWNWPGLSVVYKCEQNGSPPHLKINDKFNHNDAQLLSVETIFLQLRVIKLFFFCAKHNRIY